jgi:hypothetical protein
MKNIFRKTILATLIVSILVTSTFVAYPKKAEAASTTACWVTFITEFIKGLIKGKIELVLNVPATSGSTADATTQSSARSKSEMVTDCIIKPLVNMMIKTLLREFTRSTVAWINSGFQGKPGFLTNPEGFFLDVGDQIAGQMIQQVAPTFCGPFSANLRLSLSFYYSSLDQVGCRLSDVQQNVMNAFTTSGFKNGGGWSTWLSINQHPSNNVFGAYLQASNLINNKVFNKINQKVQELTQGGGFLSFRDCEVWTKKLLYNPQSGSYEDTDSPPCVKEGPVKTPGTVIESQLNETLAWPLRDVGLAQDIDAIISALIGQMINQIFSATGLAGGNNDPYTTGDLTADLYNNYQRTQVVALPAGIPSNICATFDRTATYTVQNNVTVSVGVVQNNVVMVTTNTNNVLATVIARKTDNSLWSLKDLTDVRMYCLQTPYTGILNPAVTQAGAVLDATTTAAVENSASDPDRNLAIQRPTSQSGNFNAENTSDKAVDGIKTSSQYLLPAITARAMNPWWQVVLEKTSFIKSVKIHKRADRSYVESLGTFTVIVYDANQRTVWTSPNIDTDDTTAIPLIIPVNKNGKSVRIQRFGDAYLQLAEVEVVGNVNGTGNTVSTPETSGPFGIVFDPAVANTLNILTGQLYQNSFGIEPNGAKSNLKVTMKFERLYNNSYIAVPFKNIFQKFSVKTTNSLNNHTTVPVDLLAIAGDGNSAEYNSNLSVTANTRLSITQEMQTQYFPGVDSSMQYRLTTEIKDENGTIWRQTSPLFISMPPPGYVFH